MPNPPKKAKFTRKKLDEAVRRMMAKASELGMSLNLTKEEGSEAIDKPKFVYVGFGEANWPVGAQGGFTLRWGAEKVGFGELMFYLKDGKIHCDTECMGTEFPKAVVMALLEKVEFHQR